VTSFCEQKEAKKLWFAADVATLVPTPAVNRSFLVLFFKKEPLACFASGRLRGAGRSCASFRAT
jgi:hypothetical protein